MEGSTIEKRKKLPFGHYISKNENDGTCYECKPLSQEEYSDGWQTVLPKNSKNNAIHHWSVTLAQLPPYLWKKYKVIYEGNKQYNPVIKDYIYYYSINESKYDSELKELYIELSKGREADKNVIKGLLEKLEGQVNGWLTIRAKNFLKNKDDRYFVDLELKNLTFD